MAETADNPQGKKGILNWILEQRFSESWWRTIPFIHQRPVGERPDFADLFFEVPTHHIDSDCQ